MKTRLTAIILSCSLLPASVLAQAYPVKPIKFISPQPPGGTFDYVIRAFGERIQPSLGQPLIIEHRAGAGTVVGLDYTAKQAPDGYTLIMSSTTHSILPSIVSKLPFDPVKSFDPISLVSVTPFILVVRSDSSAHNVADYIAIAKAKPGALTFASSGVGTPLHFGGELLKAMAGLDMLHVPYKGAAAAITAVISGEVYSSFAPSMVVLPQVRSGKLRALGHLGSQRTPAMPDLPNFSETVPGYAIDSWFGVMGPAGMPRSVIERLNNEFNRAARDPQFVKEKLATAGLDGVGTTPERLREVLISDIAKYAKIVRDAKISMER